MSLLAVVPDLLQLAAGDLKSIGADLDTAHAAAAAPTTGLVAAGADEVSAAVTALFSEYGQAFQALSAQASTFHTQFVAAPERRAGRVRGRGGSQRLAAAGRGAGGGGGPVVFAVEEPHGPPAGRQRRQRSRRYRTSRWGRRVDFRQRRQRRLGCDRAGGWGRWRGWGAFGNGGNGGAGGTNAPGGAGGIAGKLFGSYGAGGQSGTPLGTGGVSMAGVPRHRAGRGRLHQRRTERARAGRHRIHWSGHPPQRRRPVPPRPPDGLRFGRVQRGTDVLLPHVRHDGELRKWHRLLDARRRRPPRITDIFRQLRQRQRGGGRSWVSG